MYNLLIRPVGIKEARNGHKMGKIPPFLYNCIISKNMGDKGPSLSLVENRSASNAGGVGNYKGVMLCNRPFAGTVGRLMNICCIV